MQTLIQLLLKLALLLALALLMPAVLHVWPILQPAEVCLGLSLICIFLLPFYLAGWVSLMIPLDQVGTTGFEFMVITITMVAYTLYQPEFQHSLTFD